MIDPRLTNKTVLITGANHGIGAATAQAFAAQGAKVFITYYREECSYTPEELENARIAAVGGPQLYWAQQQGLPDDIVATIQDQGGMAFAHEADLEDTANSPLIF